MTDERKKEYTRRVTQANPTQLLVILYEMYDDYMADAVEAASTDRAAMREGIRKARLCINQLISTLDMEQELSSTLLRIYLYVTKEMARADVRRDVQGLTVCRRLIGRLRDAYDSISSQDTSGPVMENSQEVYTGLTYGKGALYESSLSGSNRGFKV